MHEEIVYLGLGSNLGDRTAHLRAGIAGLQTRGLRLRALSPFYMTEPDLRSAHADTPADAAAGNHTDRPAHPWYANCVAAFDNAPAPRLLLALCLDVEHDEGRVREPAARDSNGGPQPRTLDIDVLLVGDRVIDEPGLRVPHPRMGQRRFVLQPLADIAADLIHPLTGVSIDDMLAELPHRERVTELDPQPREAS